MSEVICPNCGGRVILPEHSEVCVGKTISKEGNDTYVLPMTSAPARDSKGRFVKKSEPEYDVISLNNSVYIGMEDVAVTYKVANRYKCYSAEEVENIIRVLCDKWDNDPGVISERKNGRGYYPSEYKVPCKVLIAKHGVISEMYISNYDDIRNANNRGAICLSMSDGLEKALENFSKKFNIETKVEKENKTMTRAEQRIETLKARGIDTSSFFSLTNDKGEGVLMRWENGVPVTVPMEDETDPILEQIISDGYVKNTKLHRRWVMAQMFAGLNYKGMKYVKGANGKYTTVPVKGYEDYLRSHGYNYQWKMLLEEIRVISKLETRDKEAFEERTSFFDKDVVVSVCNDYLEKLKQRVDTLKIRHCKGVPYKRVSGYDFFVEDLNAKLYNPIRDAIKTIKDSPNYSYLYSRLNSFINRYVKRYKLSNDTKFSFAWKDAYKGSGAFYTMKNLIMYHNCYIEVSACDKRTGTAGIAYISLFLKDYKGEGYRYFAMMKKVIKDNNFDYAKRMKELGVSK